MRKQCVDRWTLVIMMLVLGAGSCGLLAVFWNFTSDTAFLFFFLIFQVSFSAAAERCDAKLVIRPALFACCFGIFWTRSRASRMGVIETRHHSVLCPP